MKAVANAVAIAALFISSGAAALGQGIEPVGPVAPLSETTAPPVAAQSRKDVIDSERVRIAVDRKRLEAGFRGEDATCYKRYAVNNCLSDVDVRRRAGMLDLRRQEILLNDEERKMRGTEQIRKNEQKSSSENQQDAANRRAKAVDDYQSRLENEKVKQADRQKLQDSEKANSQATSDRLKARHEKDQARNARQAAAAEQAKKYQERQQQAQERRDKHDVDQATRTKPLANPLPLP